MRRVREKRRVEERKRKSQKKEETGAQNVRKVAKHCVFAMICASGGSQGRLTKAAGAQPSGQMRDEKVHAVLVRSTFPSQNVQNTRFFFWKIRCGKSARCCGNKHMSKSKSEKLMGCTTFGSSDLEKLHAVDRSTFRSQNVKSTTGSDHFWKLRSDRQAHRQTERRTDRHKERKTDKLDRQIAS